MFFQTINIHLIDIITIGLIALGAYRGYKLGAIIQALDLLLIIIGFYILVYFTEQVYLTFLFQGLNTAPLFAALFLGASFIGLLWITALLQNSVKKKLDQIKKSWQDRIWGLILGIIKYTLIIGVYMVVVREVDMYSNFLPKTEKIAPVKGRLKSILGTGTYYITTTIAPSLKFDMNKPERTIKRPTKYVEPPSSDFYDNDF